MAHFNQLFQFSFNLENEVHQLCNILIY